MKEDISATVVREVSQDAGDETQIQIAEVGVEAVQTNAFNREKVTLWPGNTGSKSQHPCLINR